MSDKSKNKIITLERALADLEAKLGRALADYHNLEKRVDAARSEMCATASAMLIEKLLPVLDDLERAERHLKDKGLSLAIDQLREVFKSEGLEEIDVIDKTFDPMTMDCVEVIKGKKDKVAEVILKGYFLNGRVIRSAKVKVGRD